jgi:hypothetical protein
MESESLLPRSTDPGTCLYSEPNSVHALHASLRSNFNLFSVHLIHMGYDPSDMELVNTEIRLQISYMK